ncbi:hypothetical protein ACFYXS_01240 [Streptomyces sp. NPDC002574]|uniref:hypothetical protein n=1 Tax=Streptomyces sp. NPDC002574 TaxID=3364652 RepID=UPI0036A2B147
MTYGTVLGVDAGTASLREADHLIHRLVDRLGLPAGTVACTHFIRTGTPHTAVSFTLPDGDVNKAAEAAEAAWRALTAPDGAAGADTTEHDPAGPGPWGVHLAGRSHGPAPLAAAAAQAAEEAAARTGGRAVVYPGVELLTGTVTVADVLAHTPITGLPVLGSPADERPAPAVEVLTRDHVRPEWRASRLVLPLVPAVDGRLAPFEVPNPTPCCADH